MLYVFTIRRAGLAGLAGLCLASATAHAQTSPPDSRRDTPASSAPVAPAGRATVADLSPVSVEALALPVSPELAIEPVDILDGEALIARRGQTLGETLARTPGVSAADFGQGVGRPVIRGLAGARVRVQENGLGSADVSTISQDHAVSIDPYAADKIEVLKGPQTLLYGSGAIGGVVNVVSDRIPDHVPERGVEGQAVLERSDATLGQRLERLDVTAGHGPIAVNLQGTKRLTDDYKADDNQRIDNSATDTSNYSGGTSVVGDWGYVGAAASHFGRNYGIPGEEAQINLSQNRYDLRGELFEPLAGLSSLEFAAAYTDYRHTEGEAVGPPGAIFDNQTTEFRLAATHETWRDFTGTFGLQGFTRDYKAFGEAETFVPPTTTRSLAAFWVEEHPLGELWMLQGGVRVEYQDEDTSQGRPDRDYVPVSGSIGARRTIGQDYVATLSVGHYERAPATEELYSFGPHEATATFERGEADFDTEKSNSVELGFRKIHGRTRFDGALYATRFNDFIYLDSVDRGLNADGSGAFDADGQADFVDEAGTFTPGGEFQLVDYVAGDATFYGGEAELSYDLLTGPHRLTAAVQGDYVRAELDNDTNLPRITPGRYGASLTYDDARWRATFQTLQTTQSGHAAPLEPVSQSFTDMNAFVGFKIPTFDTTRALVYLRGDNLLDERIVRQSSFLRVPQPGRVVSTGIDVRF